ncbi:hypothetical protein AGMMS49579_01120 [Spirochaetia bacterium]|nr:hypothetical protein AGMMS49579_01120 [Spirochaetia bacterium]
MAKMAYIVCPATIKEVKDTYLKLIKLNRIRYINTICKNSVVSFYVRFENEPLHIEEQYTQLKYLRRFENKPNKGFCQACTYHPILDTPIEFEKMIISDSVVNTHTFFDGWNRHEKIVFGTKFNIYNPVKRTFVLMDNLKKDPNVLMIPYKMDGILYYYLEFKKDNEIVYVDYDEDRIYSEDEEDNNSITSSESGFYDSDEMEWTSDEMECED